MTALILSFLLFSFLLFTGLLSFLFQSKKDMNLRITTYLIADVTTRPKTEKQRMSLFSVLKELNAGLKKALTRNKTNLRVEVFLQSAAITWTPGEYVIYRWMAAFICGGLLYFLTSNLFILVSGLSIGFYFPKWRVAGKRNKRVKQFNDGLADMISSIVNSLKAGFSFTQALKAVEEEADSPIKEEVALVLKEMQYGATLEESLAHLNERMPGPDLDIMIQAILIQRQVGGNLATILTTIAETIRERARIHRQVKTLTAQGKMSGMVIGLMPFVLGFIIYLIQPSYVGTLFTNPYGIIMLSCGLIFGIIGFVLIQKITKIEV